jgi:hypothetical protein
MAKQASGVQAYSIFSEVIMYPGRPIKKELLRLFYCPSIFPGDAGWLLARAFKSCFLFSRHGQRSLYFVYYLFQLELSPQRVAVDYEAMEFSRAIQIKTGIVLSKNILPFQMSIASNFVFKSYKKPK